MGSPPRWAIHSSNVLSEMVPELAAKYLRDHMCSPLAASEDMEILEAVRPNSSPLTLHDFVHV